MQKRVLSIVNDISLEVGLPVDVVKAIVESQFQCAREATKKGEAGTPSTFLNIRFKHLGLLVARPHKIIKMNAYARNDSDKDMDTD
jgi:hypothetical protein